MGYDPFTWHGAVYGAHINQAELKKFVRSGGFGNSSNDNTNMASNITFSLYTNERLGFRIQYPSNWDTEEQEVTVAFVSPLEHQYDKFREGIGVTIVPATNQPLEYTADYYLNMIKREHQQLGHQIVGTYIRGGNIGQYPAAELHYMLIKNPNEERRVQIAEIGDKLILIEFRAYDFHRYLPIVDRMVSSFSLI